MLFTGSKKCYLIDGGRLEKNNFSNLKQTLQKYAKLGDNNSFKADGIILTHPDRDHIEGVLQLFKEFPPNQQLNSGRGKFEFEGPLLLTEAFQLENYEWVIKAITEANFVEEPIISGDSIKGFEEHFSLFIIRK